MSELYGVSPAFQLLRDMQLLSAWRRWMKSPLNHHLMALGGSIVACIPSDWFHRFLLRHKPLRQWLRWNRIVHY